MEKIEMERGRGIKKFDYTFSLAIKHTGRGSHFATFPSLLHKGAFWFI